MTNLYQINEYNSKNFGKLVIADVNYFVIPENEYERLIEENKQLKIEINEIYLKERELREIVRKNDLTIKELREENNLLKEELKKLKEKIESQDETIKSQNEKIKSQDEKIKSQNEKITSMEEIIKDLTKINKSNNEKKFFYNLITALQDVNNLYKLETKIPTLKILRRNRIDINHYINNYFDDIEINLYINILIEKIENANIDFINMFNYKYPNLLNDIKPELKKTEINIEKVEDQDFKLKIKSIIEDANYWWE